MRNVTKAVALLAVASIMAACSSHSGGTVTPALPDASSANRPRLTSSTAATNDGDFDYNANPPQKPYSGSSDLTASALPKPSTCVAYYGFTCYTPAEIKTAYNVPASYDGSGQTIVIIDAFGSPTIKNDVKIFDAVMGLPDPVLNVIYPSGAPSTSNDGWAGETSLDVEWAHAIAPKATIDLVISPTNHASDMHVAEDYAINNHLGNIVSMSFGASEPSIPGGASNKLLQHADSMFQKAKDTGITLVASTGDYGATNGGPTIIPQFPASDPLVLSVGGTSLFTSDDGTYQSEKVWNDSDPAQCPLGCAYGPLAAATGGAPSQLFKAPSYQQLLTHSASREVADVSYNAGVYTAVLVYQGFGGRNAFYFVGGTSSGAPQWAAIVALANQAAGHPLGFVNQPLYTIAKSASYASAFHDVTSGSNGFVGAPGESAGPGYDMPTGLGSPNVANLIPALIRASAQ